MQTVSTSPGLSVWNLVYKITSKYRCEWCFLYFPPYSDIEVLQRFYSHSVISCSLSSLYETYSEYMQWWSLRWVQNFVMWIKKTRWLGKIKGKHEHLGGQNFHWILILLRSVQNLWTLRRSYFWLYFLKVVQNVDNFIGKFETGSFRVKN